MSGSSDKHSCVKSTDGGDHCVWCGFGGSGYGLCVSESQAEALEKNFPIANCDRYSGSDDDVNPNPPPDNDDKVPVNDDSLPDDYWTCLQKKTAPDCEKASCTWCESKAGFGVCVTGPSADYANNSTWFDCKKKDDEIVQKPVKAITMKKTEPVRLEDPYDTSCIVAFLQDQTETGCINAVDENGDACEWCNIAGMANVCLTKEQVSMGTPIGISCGNVKSEEPKLRKVSSPYDVSCALAYLQDQSKETCVSTVDNDGAPCEFCSLSDSINACLNKDQAELAEQIGLDCEDAQSQRLIASVAAKDPYDTSCLLAFLQDPSKEGCVAAQDSDGKQCEFCSLQGSISLCLSNEQAEYGEQIGLTCDSNKNLEVNKGDIFDTSCMKAFFQGDQCEESLDADGQPCQVCHTPDGRSNLCLTASQGDMASQLGVWCDGERHNNNFPDDFWSCLESHEGTSCQETSCSWCETSFGAGFCVSNSIAELSKPFDFIDCALTGPKIMDKVVGPDPFDVTCAAAGMGSQDAESDCNNTIDGEGKECVWCEAAGIFGVCLSADQAATARQLLKCDAKSALIAMQ